MPFTMRRNRHPWLLRNPDSVLEMHGPARYHDRECNLSLLRTRFPILELRNPPPHHGPDCDVSGREANINRGKAINKGRSFLPKVQVKALNIWVTIKETITNTKSPVHDNDRDYSQAQCSFFSKLPTELRFRIYDHVISAYSNTIHILAGRENKDPRTIFHTPCITPSDCEIPSWSIFDSSRWSSGSMGSYHFYCDLYSSEPGILHHQVYYNQDTARALEESRTAYDVVFEAKKELQKQAPFLSLLLTCRRMQVIPLLP
jgi:hypothetical protein